MSYYEDYIYILGPSNITHGRRLICRHIIFIGLSNYVPYVIDDILDVILASELMEVVL